MGYNFFMKILLRKNIGWFAVLVLSFLPVVRWLMITPLNYRFLDLNAAMTSFGQIAGLVGMAMFSVNLILSSRLKILDKFFYGLNEAYKRHHIIGAIAFILLLFHPLFLVVKYIQLSLRDAALFFLPSGNWAVNYGIAALFLFIILMILTFFIRLKYHKWKFSHKFTVAVFVFAILHTFYTTSDVSRDGILRFYILNLAGIGLVAGFWRSFVSKYVNQNYEYEIKNVNIYGGNVFRIEMAPKGKTMKYAPGQFIFINFENKKVGGEIHPFSISSAAGAEKLEIVVKFLGDYTSELGNLKTGDIAYVEGAFGTFSYKEAENKKQIWIAGGIGITPFLSMARSLKLDECYNIHLYYCTKNKEEAVFLGELQAIASKNEKFEVINWRSSESGRISGQNIAELSGGLTDKEIFICGPVPFMESLNSQFLNMGVIKDRIHWENFNFL